MKSNVAIIGAGHQSLSDHIPAALASSDVTLKAVVEKDEKISVRFQKKYPQIAVYKDALDLINNEKIDFAIVAVPHFMHFEVTKKLIENGIHVLKEKPFATSLKEAYELCKLARKNNVHIGVTLQRRFNPIYTTFIQLVDKIGIPYYIDAKYTFFTSNPNDGWRGDKKFAGGGCLIDMGYHPIDLLMWYFGLPDYVFAELSSAAKEQVLYDAEDTAQVIFRYTQKGLWGSLLVSRVIPPKQELINVFGTRGIIHLERGKIERYAIDGTLIESLARNDSWPSAAQDQLEYFVRVIREEKKNMSSPEFHFNHLAFIESAYKSAVKHQIVNPSDLLNKDEPVPTE